MPRTKVDAVRHERSPVLTPEPGSSWYECRVARFDEAAARAAAQGLADGLNAIVGTAARSVVLHGSLAAGGFRPGRSDIDLLAVVDPGLTDAQIDALERLVRRADLGGAAGVDLHVVTAPAAAAPTRTPPLELHIGRSDGSSAGVDVVRRASADPDLPAELSMARADGRALSGVAPDAVIASVTGRWIVERGRHWLETWQSRTDDAEHASFMVLTACRIWHFAVTDVHCSKTRAARWALDREPSLTAVRQAVRQHQGRRATPIDDHAIADVLRTVLRETAPAR
jgi:hypothetical protein